VAVVFVGYSVGGGASLTFALLTDSENDPSTMSSAVKFDLIAPTVTASVISKVSLYWPGYIRQAAAYYVYANVTDGGNPPSGVATVTANASTITTGQTAVALTAGTFSVGGVSYNYRSASITANAVLAAGSYSYSVTATDASANSATQSGLTVTVDNTRPSGTTVQTTNAGVAGRPELGDSIVFTFSEVIDPETILAGWTGLSTSVVVRIANNAGGDRFTIRDATNTTALPFGTTNLVGVNYLTTQRDFGATGTASTMVVSGNTIVITLGTASGAVGTESVANNMTWVPTTTLTDRAGNTCQTTTATENGVLDLDF
jgi:hypothetical protein